MIFRSLARRYCRTEAAIECLGLDDAFSIADIDDILPVLSRDDPAYITRWVMMSGLIIDHHSVMMVLSQKWDASVEFIQLDQFCTSSIA